MSNKHWPTLVVCVIGFKFLIAQSNTNIPTSAQERIASFEKRKELKANSLVSGIPFKCIGPTVFSGRVTDLDVSADDPTHFYVAYASGGLWKTVNNGHSFTPLFDHEMVMTIGDIAVDWKRNTIWVGTGEVNSSRSSYAGTGIFVSNDGGKTWTHKGLEDSHHIGKILLHPSNPNVLLVAAMGHLYSPNTQRGVFRSDDGGNTWQHVLFVNENTGAVDLVMDPQNPNVVYAATWHRERRAWNFVESGEGSGIFKSTDGGKTWTRLNVEGAGFPTGDGVGRIGLDAVLHNGETWIYAVVDNQTPRPKQKKEPTTPGALTKQDFKEMEVDHFLTLDDAALATFLKENDFPKEYDAKKLKRLVRNGNLKPTALYDYLYDPNEDLFDAEITGAEVYLSKNGGTTWMRTHKDYLDKVYYTYGYYFGKVYVNPSNGEELYLCGVPILHSTDAGLSWHNINQENVHVDHHALWINPKRAGHLILGNDGGVNISYDNGQTWIKCNSPAVGQFYAIAVDHETNYNIYGGCQDNGVWFGPHNNSPSLSWHSTGDYPFDALLGGDGMQVAVDTRDNATVYTGFQFGNYFRINKNTGKRSRITPKHELGERPLRWNWQTPIHLSVHNQDILYIGANKVYRSMNQGNDWKAISEDLTKGGREGDVPFGTITTLHESPLQFGLLYAGSDDGLVHVTKDGGHQWNNISNGLPEGFYISRVQASAHQLGRVYVALNGYRNDVFEPMVYVSEDFGNSWSSIGDGLPQEPVNVIKEDPFNENILYVGTDHMAYVSIDRGKTWMALGDDVPDAPIHDLVVHPKAKDLILGTHGRSLYVGNVEHLEMINDSILNSNLYVFDLDKVKRNDGWGREKSAYSNEFNEPEILLPVFTNTGGAVHISIKIKDLELYSWSEVLQKGFNYLTYRGFIDNKNVEEYQKLLYQAQKDLGKEIKLEQGESGKYYLEKGDYTLVFTKDKTLVEKKLVIE